MFKENPLPQKTMQKTIIEKYDLNGNLIDTYYSLTDAILSVPHLYCRDKIKACIKEKQENAFGYVWKGQL